HEDTRGDFGSGSEEPVVTLGLDDGLPATCTPGELEAQSVHEAGMPGRCPLGPDLEVRWSTEGPFRLQVGLSGHSATRALPVVSSTRVGVPHLYLYIPRKQLGLVTFKLVKGQWDADNYLVCIDLARAKAALQERQEPGQCRVKPRAE